MKSIISLLCSLAIIGCQKPTIKPDYATICGFREVKPTSLTFDLFKVWDRDKPGESGNLSSIISNDEINTVYIIHNNTSAMAGMHFGRILQYINNERSRYTVMGTDRRSRDTWMPNYFFHVMVETNSHKFIHFFVDRDSVFVSFDGYFAKLST